MIAPEPVAALPVIEPVEASVKVESIEPPIEVATTTSITASSTAITRKVSESERIECNCLWYARTQVEGLVSGMFDAKYLVTLAHKPPKVGGIVLQKLKGKDGGTIYHVAVVKEIREKGIWVRAANYPTHCKIQSYLIEWNDPTIVLFWDAL